VRSGSWILTIMLVLFFVGLLRYLRERRRRQEMPEQDW
jgi:cbb3-type cytochrome oxidase subunit 3